MTHNENNETRHADELKRRETTNEQAFLAHDAILALLAWEEKAEKAGWGEQTQPYHDMAWEAWEASFACPTQDHPLWANEDRERLSWTGSSWENRELRVALHTKAAAEHKAGELSARRQLNELE